MLDELRGLPGATLLERMAYQSQESQMEGDAAGRDHRPRQAMVLSGGGSNGAYEIGVLRALLEGRSWVTGHQPMEPLIYTGTSVGSYNATMMASQPGGSDRDSAAYLDEVWQRRIAESPSGCGNGVYRLRTGPLALLNVQCILDHPFQTLRNTVEDSLFLLGYCLERGTKFVRSSQDVDVRASELVDISTFVSVAPLRRLIAETLDFDRLRHSHKRLYVAVSDWSTGQLAVFGKDEITDQLRGKAVLASAAIPAIFPPVSVNEVLGVDGGLLMNSPIGPAVGAGADIVHVIYVDPRVEDIRLPEFPSTIHSMFRMYSIMSAAQIEREIAWVDRFRRGTFHGPLSVVKKRLENLTVHAYRPRSLEGADRILDFSARRIKSLIEHGYRDAVDHDCRASGCKLPEK